MSDKSTNRFRHETAGWHGGVDGAAVAASSFAFGSDRQEEGRASAAEAGRFWT
jgi:hypothetical protein